MIEFMAEYFSLDFENEKNAQKNPNTEPAYFVLKSFFAREKTNFLFL